MNDNENKLFVSLCGVLSAAKFALQALEETGDDPMTAAFRVWAIEGLRKAVNDYHALEHAMLQQRIAESNAPE